MTHKRLFDENTKREATTDKVRYFAARLSIITQEYTLLQICKLHDPAIQKWAVNVTIDYIVRFGEWGVDLKQIRDHVQRLDILFDQLKSARNKILAHNDLEVITETVSLGKFTKGLDEEYFAVLQKLVNKVHEKWHDGPYPFNDLAVDDVEEFLHLLERGGLKR